MQKVYGRGFFPAPLLQSIYRTIPVAFRVHFSGDFTVHLLDKNPVNRKIREVQRGEIELGPAV